MFGRRSPATMIASVDAAFDHAEANAREFGRTVAEQITKRWRSGAIDRGGVDALVELALSQTASEAAGVPKAMLKSILATLHLTIRTELATVDIDIAELRS